MPAGAAGAARGVWRGLEDRGVPVPASPVLPGARRSGQRAAAAAAAENGGSQSAGLWKQKVGPVLLRLRVQKAFQQAGAAHARKHAVDEADYERVGATPQESVAVAQVLGRVQPTLKQLLGPLVLKVRVARAFRGSAAPSWAEPAADVTDDAEPSADASAESSEIGEEEEDDESLFLLPKHLAGDLAITTARWALVAELQPTDTPPPSLCDALRTRIAGLSKGAAAAGSSSSSVGPSALSPSRARAAMVALDLLLAEMECWGTVGSVTDQGHQRAAGEMDDGTAISMQLVSDAAPYVAAVVRAKRLIIDENAPAMSKHLESMWSEQMKDGESEVKKAGMRMRTVLKFRAQYIHRALTPAMDNLASQLRAVWRTHFRSHSSVYRKARRKPTSRRCARRRLAPFASALIDRGHSARLKRSSRRDAVYRLRWMRHLRRRRSTRRQKRLRRGRRSSRRASGRLRRAAASVGLSRRAGGCLVYSSDPRRCPYATRTSSTFDDDRRELPRPVHRRRRGNKPLRQACAARANAAARRGVGVAKGRGSSTAGDDTHHRDCAYASMRSIAFVNELNLRICASIHLALVPPASSYEQMRHLAARIEPHHRPRPRLSDNVAAAKHHAVSSGLTSLSAEEFTAIAQTHVRARLRAAQRGS